MHAKQYWNPSEHQHHAARSKKTTAVSFFLSHGVTSVQLRSFSRMSGESKRLCTDGKILNSISRNHFTHFLFHPNHNHTCTTTLPLPDKEWRHKIYLNKRLVEANDLFTRNNHTGQPTLSLAVFCAPQKWHSMRTHHSTLNTRWCFFPQKRLVMQMPCVQFADILCFTQRSLTYLQSISSDWWPHENQENLIDQAVSFFDVVISSRTWWLHYAPKNHI